MKRLGFLGWLLVAALVASACGQRPGVFLETASQTEGELVEGGGSFGGEDGVGVDGAVDGVGGGAGSGAAGGGRGARSATGQLAGPGGSLGAADDGPVWGKEIVVGIHVPVTGAASLKAEAFRAGQDLYWRFLQDRGVKVHGRTVKIVFEDDRYNPSTAATLCKQMVEGQNAFMLIGAAGTDQIVECARFSSTRGIPYLSAGVTENVVARLPNYFAVSMSYPDQGPLLADHLKELEATDACRARGVTCDNQMRVALIVSDTPNFDDAAEGFREAFKDRFGRDVDYFKVVSKEGSQQEAAQQATALRQWNNGRGVDVVYILSSVTFVVNLATSLDDAYRPRFVGVGITMVNQGVDLACAKGAFEGAHYFNPFPAWAQRNEFDPDFDKAVAEQGKQGENVPNGGDLMLSLWTLSRVIHKALEHAGPELTRGGFIRAMESFTYSERKAYPDLAYSPTNHFGAKGAHLLEAGCQVQGNSRGQFLRTVKPAWS